jgi:Dehydratase family
MALHYCRRTMKSHSASIRSELGCGSNSTPAAKPAAGLSSPASPVLASPAIEGVASPKPIQARAPTAPSRAPVLTISPEAATITADDPGVQLLLRRQSADGTVKDLTGPAAWRIDPPGFGEIEAGGHLRPLAAGKVSVKVVFEGQEVAAPSYSDLSTGACIGHISPEALAGCPLGKVRDGDLIRIVVDRINLQGSLDLVGGLGETNGEKEEPDSTGLMVVEARPGKRTCRWIPEIPHSPSQLRTITRPHGLVALIA